LLAGSWYASPSALGTGNGSIASPWHLQIALTNPAAAIQPGDTLFLRAGTYRGPFISALSGTANNYVTIRSHPGEWAVITDGQTGTLLTNLPAAGGVASNVRIAGSELWPLGTILLAGTEQWRLYIKSGTNWSVERGHNGSTPTTHASNDVLLVMGDIITQNGSYVRFQDFEITSLLTTNRVVGTSRIIGSGLNLPSGRNGNKAINLVIHNTGHPAIGFWNQGDGGEINGCLMWGTAMYDNNGTWIRGASVYAQNHTGLVYLKNNIVFRNGTEGMQAYGTAARVNGFRFINNITMQNAIGYGIAVWNAGVPMTNNACWTNYHGLDGQIWGYTSASNRQMSVLGNVLVKPPTLFLKNHISGEMKWNSLFYDGRGVNNGMLVFSYPEFGFTNMTFDINHNAYAYTNHATDLFGRTTLDFPPGSGKRTFSQWQSELGFDAASSFQAGFPEYLKVVAQPLDYDPNRWHVCVVNTTTATNATLDLASLGFTGTQRWQLRDAQNYFTVIDSGTGNGTISLPLTLTNVAEIPGVTNFVNKHTNVDEPGLFNAFVLQRLPGIGPPSNLRPVPPP
jgi:hypothetical protein